MMVLLQVPAEPVCEPAAAPVNQHNLQPLTPKSSTNWLTKHVVLVTGKHVHPVSDH